MGRELGGGSAERELQTNIKNIMLLGSRISRSSSVLLALPP